MAEERGRPTLFTEEIRSQLILAVSKGNYISQAAVLCGITRQTVFGWMKKGKDAGEGEYYDFFVAIRKAEAKVEEMCISGVLSKGDPKDYEWYLERKCPERWGRDRLQLKLLEKEFAAIKAEHQAMKDAAQRVTEIQGKSDTTEAE